MARQQHIRRFTRRTSPDSQVLLLAKDLTRDSLIHLSLFNYLDGCLLVPWYYIMFDPTVKVLPLQVVLPAGSEHRDTTIPIAISFVGYIKANSQ